jgi:integrase/recombinase XerD
MEFTSAGFGNKFREWCNEADLPQCSSHGLRKAMATRLAENRATTQEIMSVLGHRSVSEVERYTKEANKPKLADSGMAKLRSSNEEH